MLPDRVRIRRSWYLVADGDGLGRVRMHYAREENRWEGRHLALA